MSDNNSIRHLSKMRRFSLLSEFMAFTRKNKKWWLFPIILMLLILGILIWLSGSALAPFIYPLF
jgi:hypothetical protein